MSYLTQMAGLAWHNFTSAAAGIGVALALARGLTRRPGPGRREDARQLLGRSHPRASSTCCCRSASSSRSSSSRRACIQNLSRLPRADHARGREADRSRSGPVASQEAIKELGTNGGGFFNANSAHPFENPTPLTNFLADGAHLRDPGGAHLHLRPDGARPRGRAGRIFAAMAVLFFAGVGGLLPRRGAAQPGAGRPAPSTTRSGNMEGKEVRFGVADSALFATVTTDASCGAVNSMHDSFTPLGGLVPLVNIQLGEVIFGGVGAGLYGMLVMVVLTVFIAGLMVGRTPEYLGKKIEAREMKLAMLYVLIFPLLILGFAAWAAVAPLRRLVAQQRRSARPDRRSSTPTRAAPATTARPSPASTPTRPGGTSRSALAMLVGPLPDDRPGARPSPARWWARRSVAPGPGTFPTNGALVRGPARRRSSSSSAR